MAGLWKPETPAEAIKNVKELTSQFDSGLITEEECVTGIFTITYNLLGTSIKPENVISLKE